MFAVLSKFALEVGFYLVVEEGQVTLLTSQPESGQREAYQYLPEDLLGRSGSEVREIALNCMASYASISLINYLVGEALYEPGR